MTEGLAASTDAPQAGELELRVARQRLSSVCQELRRSWLPVMATDVIAAWVVGREGLWPGALAWLIAVQGATVWRLLFALRLRRQMPEDSRPALRKMIVAFGVTGFARAALVALAFAWGGEQTKTILTMLFVGMSAGAVATVGGERRMMQFWAMPVIGSLALGWLLQYTILGLMFAVLLTYAYVMLVGYVGLLGDQGTQLIERALELERERDRVAAANDSKTRFLAAASHDLRQPLYALSLNASALSDVASRLADPTLARIDQGIRRALVQCRSLLDQLLDISKLEAQAVEVSWLSTDLAQLLLSMQPQYEALAREKELTWRLDLGTERALVWTDPALLERLLGNLFDNAIKFTASGEISVRLRRPANGTHVAVDVSDTGPGIPVEERERVFEEFYQVGNPSRDRARGLGLGLSIVRRVGALIHASVGLESTPGRGCLFTVELPLADSRVSAPMTAANEEVAALPERVHGRRVLVIDDELDLLEDLTTLLTLKGWSVVTAASVDEARMQASSVGRLDVILADYRLNGGTTGLQAITAVRSVAGAVPAVIVTGDTAPQRIAEANAAGFPVLHKPLEGEAVVRMLREAIEARG